ncbi:MAG: Hsp20/alpha crystallin family protein [Candidatus Hydrogenedentes bacterium]|nr:Hsp20/alpha crystallin family protein [Candidatus Hydrogenedentota bacterium]
MTLVELKNGCGLTPWSAWRDLETEMERLFADASREAPPSRFAWAPAVDVTESADNYTLDLDLPGLKKEEIEVSVTDDVITVKGERKNDREVNHPGYRRHERRYGKFERSFRIPDAFNKDQVTANFENGVLTLTLPKREEAKPKRIEVRIN